MSETPFGWLLPRPIARRFVIRDQEGLFAWANEHATLLGLAITGSYRDEQDKTLKFTLQRTCGHQHPARTATQLHNAVKQKQTAKGRTEAQCPECILDRITAYLKKHGLTVTESYREGRFPWVHTIYDACGHTGPNYRHAQVLEAIKKGHSFWECLDCQRAEAEKLAEKVGRTITGVLYTPTMRIKDYTLAWKACGHETAPMRWVELQKAAAREYKYYCKDCARAPGGQPFTAPAVRPRTT